MANPYIRPESDAEILDRLHGMFARRVKDRRMEILGMFQDSASTNWAGPGHVTVNQFARAIDSLGFRVNRQELTALCGVYCDTDLKNEFNYVQFCAEVDPVNGLHSSVKGHKATALKQLMTEMNPGGTKEPEKWVKPGNPYFDTYGQVKPFSQTGSLSPRSPRKAGLLPVGASIIAGNTPVVSPSNAERTVQRDLAEVSLTRHQDITATYKQEATVNEEGVDDDLARIQATVFRRRLRTKEFFKGWDPRQTGRITREQFSRGIANIIHPNTFYDPETPIDIEALTDHFRDYSPGVTEPCVVSYARFVHSMDAVFNKHGLENRPTTSVPKPGHCVVDAGGFQPRPVGDEVALKELLRRISHLVDIHGIDLNTCFNDCQRSDADVRSGRISADAFMRHFPLAKNTPKQPAFLKRKDMEMLIQRYTDDNGWIRLFAFNGHIYEIQKKKPLLIESRRNLQKAPSQFSDHNSINAIVGKLGL